MIDVEYGTQANLAPEELTEFYRGLHHPVHAEPAQIQRMMKNSAVFITARVGGRLVGIARGVSDGVRGYLTECKLDPSLQGPAAVTRTDGRVEHDTNGIAREMANRVLERLFADGVQRVDTVAYGTELDFCEELGFKRNGGLVGVTLMADDWAAVAGRA